MIAGLPLNASDVFAWGVLAFRALPPETQHELIADVRRLAGKAVAELAARAIFFEGSCSGDPATDAVRERAALKHLQVAAADRIAGVRPTTTDQARGIA